MTYEYMCDACGHQWEAQQSIKDDPLDTCESCKKKKAKRLISGGTGFLLKGGGWYADGYGSSRPASSKSSKSESNSSDSGSSSESKSKSSSSTPSSAKSSGGKASSSSSKAD